MSDDCGCRPSADLASRPAYRRALGLVVALNLGMGTVEMVTGLLAGSQALKADALDFIGDGVISGLGLAVIGSSMPARTRVALAQGGFLGLLGMGVLLTTAYRILVATVPEAGTMGVVGGIALAINIASAALLLPHREGDATVRAAWLFSRNDAIGNVAVMVAGGAVALIGAAWPDLLVALVIAGLFLHSAADILRTGVAELREHAAGQ